MTRPDFYLPRRLLHIFFADHKDRKTDVEIPSQKHKKKEKWLPGYTTVFWKDTTCFSCAMKNIQEKNFWDRHFLFVLCRSFQQSLKWRLKLPSITSLDFQSWPSITTLLDVVTKELMKHDQPEGIECKHKIPLSIQNRG